MTAATQGYKSPSVFDPSNMFAPSGRNSAKSNDYFKAIGKGAANNRTIEPQQTTKHTPRSVNVEPVDADDTSFFDFDPPANPGSPFRDHLSTPGALGMPWGSEAIFRPLSPPDSASFSPTDPWQYPYQHQQRPNIFTDLDSANTRAQYGQVTPPDDEDDNMSLLDYQLKELDRQQQKAVPPAKKRKQIGLSGANEQASQPTKRSRKYASRGSDAKGISDKPEDVKRSKFLERNRVAASKCRQKKKEWTQNLESRARELQKNNNMLRINVESLREEILFLKGEMLKHSTCDCKQIQSFMKSETNNSVDSPNSGAILKREHSPIESMSGSPESQVAGSLCDFDDTTPAVEQSDTSIVDNENALEALLSSSINHDTSDEAIVPQTGS